MALCVAMLASIGIAVIGKGGVCSNLNRWLE